jgi:L-iditol 2-dehydrogenase
MKALLVTEPFKYELTDVDVPPVGEGQVLVGVGACGICGSDLDIIEGSRPMEVTAYPVILGHEFSGEVAEVGKKVKDLKAGDKVAVDTVVRCDKDTLCIAVQV